MTQPEQVDPATYYNPNSTFIVPLQGAQERIRRSQLQGFNVPDLRDSVLPAGMIMMWSILAPPDGWLLCNGALVNRSSYFELYETIGDRFGAGDGSSTFQLPNFQGRLPVGMNGATFLTLGTTGGAETHNHWTGVSFDGGGLYVVDTPNLPRSRVVAKNHISPIGGALVGGNTREDSTYDESSLPPYLTVNFIIKY